MTRPIVITLAALALLATAASAHYHHHHDHDNGCDGEECNWDWNLMFNSNQSIDDSFRECFCYNETSRTWCANDPHAPGATYFLRTSCRRMISNLFIWDSFAIIPLFVFLLFPLLFCMGRLLCNCCGGRQPSYGCCCPADNKLVSADPKFKRPYSRCSIWFATILAAAIVVAAVVCCAHGLAHNKYVHDTVGAIDSFYETQIFGMAHNDAKTVFTGIYTSGVANSSQLATVEERMTSFYENMHRVLKQLPQGEHERSGMLQLTIALPLATFLILLVLCVARVRGWSVTLLANFLCLLAAVACVAMFGYMVLWTAADAVCNNKDHANQFLFNVSRGQTGCGVDGPVFRLANASLVAAVNTACDNGLRQLCAPDAFNCSRNVCQNMYSTSGTPGWTASTASPSSSKWTLAWSSRAPTGRKLTIIECAQDTTCQRHAQAKQLYNAYFQNTTDFFNSFNAYGLCQNLPQLAGVCSQNLFPGHSLHHGLGLIAFNQLALMLICFVGTFVFIHGSKRFVMYHKQSQDPREARDEAMTYVTAQPVHDQQAPLMANADYVPMPAMSNHAKSYGSINRNTIRQSDDVERIEYPSKPNPEEL